MTGPQRPRIVWREDGKLVDATTAKRPHRFPAWADRQMQQILDEVAQRLLDEQLGRDGGKRR